MKNNPKQSGRIGVNITSIYLSLVHWYLRYLSYKRTHCMSANQLISQPLSQSFRVDRTRVSYLLAPGCSNFCDGRSRANTKRFPMLMLCWAPVADGGTTSSNIGVTLDVVPPSVTVAQHYINMGKRFVFARLRPSQKLITTFSVL